MKLTNEALDKMISEELEGLDERNLKSLNIKLSPQGKMKSTNRLGDVAKELGVSDKKTRAAAGLPNYTPVAAADGDKTTIEDDDFEAIMGYDDQTLQADPDKQKLKNYVDLVYRTTDDPDIQRDLLKIKQSGVAKSADYQKTVKGKSKFSSISRAMGKLSKGAKRDSAKAILSKNKEFGAGVSVPKLDLNQMTGKEGNPAELLNFAAKTVGTANDIESGLSAICKFMNEVSSGAYELAQGSTGDKISTLFNNMILIQSFISATKSFEESAMGFMMEGFFAILIQGIVKGSNQEGEDLIQLSGNKLTLYSSKFIVGDKISLGKNTATALLDYIGKSPAPGQKHAGKNVSSTIKYIVGKKDSPQSPKIVNFFTGEYDASDIAGAVSSGELDASKLKPVAGATMDLTKTNVEMMTQNFGAYANSLKVDLDAIFKSMNNFKIFVSTYFQDPKQIVAAEASVAEHAVMKNQLNAAYDQMGAGQKLSENEKLTEELLDKMIKAVIL